MGGPDADFSLDEAEFTEMVSGIRNAEKSIGLVSYKLTEKQISGMQFTRSLYVSDDVKKGDVITKENVRSVRPGYGMHPKFLEQIYGKKFIKNVTKGTRLEKKLFN